MMGNSWGSGNHFRPDRRELINIANQQQTGFGWMCAEEMQHERDIHHRSSIQKITVQRVGQQLFQAPQVRGRQRLVHAQLLNRHLVFMLALEGPGLGQKALIAVWRGKPGLSIVWSSPSSSSKSAYTGLAYRLGIHRAEPEESGRITWVRFQQPADFVRIH